MPGLERAIDEAGDVQFRPSLPFLHVVLVSSLQLMALPYRSKSDRWPKTSNVTLSHSLKGQLFGPECDNVTWSHSKKGQLYGPNRDRKLSKNSNMVKKLFKNSKNRKRDSVTFLERSTFWPKTCRRDDVTFLKRSTFWPRIYVENTRDSVVFGLFSVSVT